MHMPDMLKLNKDWKHNIKSLHLSLIKSIYFLNEIISVRVGQTKTDVFTDSLDVSSLEFIMLYLRSVMLRKLKER